MSTGLAVVLGYLFYDSFYMTVIAVPLYFFLLKVREPVLRERRKYKLCVEFREAILAVAASLNAGYSIENAFRESLGEIERLYGTQSDMYRELKYMTGKMSMNVSIEELLDDFSARSDCEDINTFCQVFIFAKRGGGDFGHIIKKTADRMGEKLQLKSDIDTELSAKKYEAKVMNIMPLFIIGYVRFSTPDYFSVLYHNLSGILIMTAALAVYAAAYMLGEKIMNIVV